MTPGYDPKTCWMSNDSKVPHKRYVRLWPPTDGDVEWTPEKWKRGDLITLVGFQGQVVELTPRYVVLDTRPELGPPLKMEAKA